MRLSVCIVTYQEAGVVRQCLESALTQQTTFPFEVVVGDDASTDGTRDVLHDLQREWPDRLRLLLPDQNYGDRGLTNFLTVLDACEGEYVALLDGDDYWTAPDKLQRQVEFLDEHPECALVGHRVIHQWDDGYERRSPVPSPGDAIYDVGALLDMNIAHKISSVHRRENLGDYPDWLGTTTLASVDWIFTVLAARHGAIGFIDESMAVHRQRSGGLLSEYGMVRVLEDRLRAYDLLAPMFPDHADGIRRGRRRVRRKLWLARLGPRVYERAKRASGSLR